MSQTFNDDLFLYAEDIDKARAAFPNVFFALDNPELRADFKPIDVRALKAKKRSRYWGVFAVALATFALMLAAAEILYHDYPKEVRRFIAGVGAVAGIASVLIGVFGVMYRDRKEQWLADRFATERLRQFHFQHYAARAPEIIGAIGSRYDESAFQSRRADDYAKAKLAIVSRAREELRHLVHAEDPGDGLLIEQSEGSFDPASPHLHEYFRAFETLRFDRQIGYCDYMLREKGGFWKHLPRQQARIIAAVATFSVFAILALHASVFIGALSDISWMKGPEIHVLAIFAAIIALAARTIEEGFQPETEIERLRQYRLALKRIHARFRNATDPREKIKAMLDVEKQSFEEMVLFLRTNHEAQFVM